MYGKEDLTAKNEKIDEPLKFSKAGLHMDFSSRQERRKLKYVMIME